MTFNLAGGNSFVVRTVAVLQSKTIEVPTGLPAKNTALIEAWGAGGAGYGRNGFAAQCAAGSSGEYRAGWYDLAAGAELDITIPAGIAGPSDAVEAADPSDTTITNAVTLTAASGISANQSVPGIAPSGGSGGTMFLAGNVGLTGDGATGGVSPVQYGNADLPDTLHSVVSAVSSGSYKTNTYQPNSIGIGLPVFSYGGWNEAQNYVIGPGGHGGQGNQTTAGARVGAPGLVLISYRIEF